MPIVKDKQPSSGKKFTDSTVKPENSSIVFDEAFFAEIASKDFFKEKRERVTKILEKVDWSEPLDKPKQ